MCAEVIRRERLLLDPNVRAQPQLVQALIHPDFVEFGVSGRIWDAESIVIALASETVPIDVTAHDFVAQVLAPGLVQLTFRTSSGERRCLRSSLWVQSEDNEWLLRFHQGTVIPGQTT